MDSPFPTPGFTDRVKPPPIMLRKWWLAERARVLADAIQVKIQNEGPDEIVDGEVLAWLSELQGILTDISCEVAGPRQGMMPGRR